MVNLASKTLIFGYAEQHSLVLLRVEINLQSVCMYFFIISRSHHEDDEMCDREKKLLQRLKSCV